MDKNKIMMISIIALLVILLLGVGVVAMLVLRMPNSHTEPAGQLESVLEIDPQLIHVIPLTSGISTNLLTDTDGARRDVRIGISIGVDTSDTKASESLIELLTRQEAIIRGIALGIVRNKTYSELNRPDGKEMLVDEILMELQRTFRTNMIVQVYITEFYLV